MWDMLYFGNLAWGKLFLFTSSFDFRIHNKRFFDENIEEFSKSILHDS